MATRPKSRSPVLRPKNLAKGKSYAEAWRRIKLSNDQGFYFETVAICESIISDRLLSYLNGAIGTKFDTRTSLSDLNKAWAKALKLSSDKTTQSHELAVDLNGRINDWRIARNEVVHGLAKSMPGEPSKEWREFITQTKAAADAGAALARLVSKWHRDSLKYHQEEVWKYHNQTLAKKYLP
jgi:hypothetical protein